MTGLRGTGPARKAYRLAVARGENRTPIDAATVRARIKPLTDEGFPPPLIARVAAVSAPTVASIVSGRTSRVKRPEALRLLKVTRRTVLDAAAGLTRIPAVGARRRLEALMVMGWPIETVAAQYGRSITEVTDPDALIAASTHHAVCAAFRDLWNRPGPSQSSRIRAANAGWMPPAAWDDIDDPACRPVGVYGRAGRSRDRLVEDVEELVADGATVASACARLGKRRENLSRTLQRAGRNDLWRALTGTTPRAGRSGADVEAEDGGAA